MVLWRLIQIPWHSPAPRMAPRSPRFWEVLVQMGVQRPLYFGVSSNVDCSGRVLVGSTMVQMCGRRVCLHGLPPLAIVQLHPVILAVLNLTSALECLGEQLAQIVVVWSILKSKVADIA